VPESPQRQRAIAAALATASTLGLTADDAIVLQVSNRVTVRLMPCDVVARVAPVAYRSSAELEVELARRLATNSSPVVPLDPRVEPRVYVHDGFVMNMWTYCASVSPHEIPPADYAHALERLHAGMREIDLPTPHFTDRVEQAQRLVGNPELTPGLGDADRELLDSTLRDVTREIREHGAVEQLLHGEPHPGNVLGTTKDLRFIDLETCCRGPVEIDLAYVPEVVSVHYRNIDPELLAACRHLTLAMVAAWRWDRDDEFPNGRRAGQALIDALRDGPPWPALVAP
jgi:Ser/Thr protein kinase RdoA (MazF antagonist)